MSETTPDARQLELLDSSSMPYDERRRALADLHRVNRWLLGYRPIVRAVVPRILECGGTGWLLDVGTGSGEAAARIESAVARAAGRGAGARSGLRVVGLDSQLSHLVIGRGRAPHHLRVVGSADALPFRDDAFDWSLSTLFFHHFDGAGNQHILSEMWRVCRRAVMVVDLRRGRITPLLARLLLTLIGVGHVARHDGVISAAQAYDLEDVRAMTRGLPVSELVKRFPRRFSLILAPAGPDPAATAQRKRPPNEIERALR